MIIKYSKHLELSEWEEHPNGWCRYKLGLLEDGNKYHEHGTVMIFTKMLKSEKSETWNFIVKHVRFYVPLHQLDKLYNPNNIVLDWHLDFTKNSVDKFLMKMSSLIAFG